jgi:S1-C subfamily serine protease
MFSKVKQMGAVAALTLSLGVAAGFSMAGPLQTVQGQSAMDSQTALLHNIYAKANPSVVSIDVRLPATATNSNPFGGRGQQSPFGQPQTSPQQYSYAAGSGFLYDSTGNIVTNAHVVEGADKIEVTFSDGTQFHATVVGIDLDSDIAVIKVQGDTSKYQPLQIANSDQVTIGDLAVAIGNPFEEAGTMTKGIVSGVQIFLCFFFLYR